METWLTGGPMLGKAPPAASRGPVPSSNGATAYTWLETAPTSDQPELHRFTLEPTPPAL